MIDFLLGVPGKLKAISDYLTTNWTAGRAAKLDLITVAPAPASTALSNAVWTDARAAMVDAAVKVTDPTAAAPIAANFGPGSFTTALTTEQLALSITGTGLINTLSVNSGNSGGGTYYGYKGWVRLVIDGITVMPSRDFSGYGPDEVFRGVAIPFRSSIQVYLKATSGNASVSWNLYRTA